MSIAKHPDINGNLTLTVPGWNSGGVSFVDPHQFSTYGGHFTPEGAPPVGSTEPDAGEFTTLMSLPSLGMNVELAFFYNSHSTHNSRFGFRRICNLHLRALTAGDLLTSGPNAGAYSNVMMLRGDDSKVAYVYAEASQSFQGEAGNPNRLRFDAASSLWLEETPDGRVMAFAVKPPTQEAPILWAQDARGNQHTFDYDAGGLLVALHDAVGRTVNFAYNAQNLLQSVTDWAGRTVSFEYAAQAVSGERLLSRVVGANGHTEAEYDYDGNGWLTAVRDAENVETRYTLDFGKVTQRSVQDLSQPTMAPLVTHYQRTGDYQSGQTIVTDALGQMTTFTITNGNVTRIDDGKGTRYTVTHDAAGRETSRTNGKGDAWQSPRDDKGAPTSVTDGKGQTTVLGRDAWSNLTQVTAPDGAVEQMAYTGAADATGQKRLLRSRTDALGNVTLYFYDARGLLVRVADPLGYETTWSYDSVGNQIGMTDALGSSTSQSYDAAGNAVSSVDAEGNFSSASYDRGNRVTQTTDALGNVTQFAYDGLGRLVQSTDALGGVRHSGYNVFDQVTHAMDEAGQSTLTQYDALGRVVARVDALGHRSEQSYDVRGHLIATTVAAGELNLTTQIERDVAGQAVAMVDPNGARTSFQLDANGQTISQTDAAGATTSFVYDSLRRLISQTDSLGRTQATTYDAAGRVTALQDALGHTTTLAYNGLGRLTSQTNVLNQTTSFAYDAAGRRVGQTDAKGQRTAWTYDAANRVTQSRFADGSSIGYTYDAAGQTVTMQDSTGTTLYGYDALCREVSVTYGSGHALSYAYDAVGSRTQMTDPDNGVTLYQNDANRRLTQLTNPQGEVTQFVYDALDRVVKKTLANGVVETHSFDGGGRETLIEQRNPAGTLLASFASAYNAVNRRTQNSEADGSVTTYAYDSEGQLLSESRTGTHPYARTYTYDGVGNRLSKVEAGLRTTYVYDAANQLLSQETRNAGNAVVSQGTMQYDPNGCLLQQVQDGATTSYAWNAQSFLIQMILPNSERETYSYCGEGIRRKTQSNAGIRLFIRDGKNILLEADASNATMRRYTHMSDNWGTLLSLREGGASHFYGFDGSANTRLLTDANAGVSDAYLYSAFGEDLQITGSSANPLRFGGEVGYYRDTMKRTYVRARHLDVGAGRWMSRDPIGFEGGWNLYEYAFNCPSTNIDPTGESPCLNPCGCQKSHSYRSLVGLPQAIKYAAGFTLIECEIACASNKYPLRLCANFCKAVVKLGCDGLFGYCGTIPGNNMKNMCMSIYLTLCAGE